MSSTVTYKGSTLTTVENQTRVLNTRGTWLEDNITITDVTQNSGTSAISVVDTLDSNGGTIRTITALDISDTTAVAADVAQGKYFYTAQGIKTLGTASGGGATRTIIVPEQTIEVSGNYTQLDFIFSLVEGEEYIYTIDGTEYRGVAGDLYGSTAIGSRSVGYIEYVISNNLMYFTIAESPSVSYGTYTIKVEKEVSSSSGQTATGTVTGSGTTTLEIPCSFEPDVIHVYGDMSADVSNRGVVDFTLIKDEAVFLVSDASSSADTESVVYYTHDITGYNDSSNPHASYANSTLTIDTVTNSSAYRWLSGQTYTYELRTLGASGSSTPSATAHSIYFEFSDGTDTTLTYYDNEGTFINSAITSTTPTTYGGKTVTLAQLDGVAWYEPMNIPLNTQLVDYTKITADHSINSNGELVADQWYGATDYIVIDPSMTFSYKGNYWGSNAFYDSSKTFISYFIPYEEDMDTASDNNNVGVGTLGGSGITIPSNAVYIRITTLASPDDTICSLIRTA